MPPQNTQLTFIREGVFFFSDLSIEIGPFGTQGLPPFNNLFGSSLLLFSLMFKSPKPFTWNKKSSLLLQNLLQFTLNFNFKLSV